MSTIAHTGRILKFYFSRFRHRATTLTHAVAGEQAPPAQQIEGTSISVSAGVAAANLSVTC